MSKRLISKTLIITLIATTMLMFASVGSYATSVSNATGQIKNKNGNIVRKSTSTSSKKVMKLKNNTNIVVQKEVFKSKTSTSKSKRWYKITANGKTGYVMAKRVDNIAYAPVQAVVNKKVTYRAGAGTKMKKKGTLSKGTVVNVLLKATPVSSTKGSSSTWYKIQVGGKIYYACSAYFSLVTPAPANPSAGVATGEVSNPAPTINVPSVDIVLPAKGMINSSNGVNVRAKTNTSSTIVSTLGNNKVVSITKAVFKSSTSTAADKKWYKISADGVTGYVRADLVDNITYNPVSAKTSCGANYRVGAGTGMTCVGSLSKGTSVNVVLEAEPVESAKGDSMTWYMIQYNGNYYYTTSTNIDVTSVPSAQKAADEDTFIANLRNQGFPESYITPLVKLHRVHPNWKFTAKGCGAWSTAVSAECKGSFSLIQRSGSAWVSANADEVSYYMDPRNFLNEERIFMFEKLSYDPTIHTEAVVNKVLSGTKLATYGFQAAWFVTYGAQYDVSPVHIASRARQETGGGSIAIDGTGKSNGVVVYNPFNIGAYSDVKEGLTYAYKQGWTTKEASIKGGAQFLGKDYINKGQNTIYSQKFNIVNGAASHQYMQNIKAPFAEAYSTYASYLGCGILYDGHTFIIPVYSGL